jgi:hypothetical protein
MSETPIILLFVNRFEMADTHAAGYKTCNALSTPMVRLVYEELS